MDGRDTAPKEAIESLTRLNSYLTFPGIEIKSLSGRYFAMDRDNRWERTRAMYALLTEGQTNHHAKNALLAVENAYQQGITDEFIPPTLIGSNTNIEDGDWVIAFNFRADRMRQLISALSVPDCNELNQKKILTLGGLLTFTEYATHFPADVIFPRNNLTYTLGEMLSLHGLRQLRLAETEKYAHVTFF